MSLFFRLLDDGNVASIESDNFCAMKMIHNCERWEKKKK